jgi:hypothetical protein
MVKISNIKLPTSTPSLAQINQAGFGRGVITLINESKLPNNALKEGNNLMLYEDGNPGPRWGTGWYGNAVPNGMPIDGANYFTNPADGSTHLIVIAGGVVYRSLDNAVTWTACTGATLTSGKKCYLLQANSYMYITNGTDVITRYDGSTVLQQYTPLIAPSGLSTSVTGTGITGTTYTWYYRIVAVNQVGFSQGSASITATTSKTRDNFDPTSTGANYVTVNWAAVTGAVRYDVYLTDNLLDNNANNLFYLNSVSGTSYIDNGQDIQNPNSQVPTQNTSTGPLVAQFVSVGSRIWGVRDTNNAYRVWWSGSGPFIGYFSDSYDGGYIDLQKGSQFFPTMLADYRDGKGNSLTTVWCNSDDGLGCIWQIDLQTLTVVNTTFTEPVATKLPGSRGTPAPNSVVNVLNDYLYYNSQGFYDLGSRANLLNLLSTDEYSVNIRPTLQSINNAQASGIAGYYYLGKVFMSVNYGGTSNNATIIYDPQIPGKPWLPYGYTIGFERFFQYADTSSNKALHLLAWKTGDSRLSETASTIQGDYGQPFATSLITGQVNTTKSRFDFMWVEDAEIEVANPQGTINLELLGVERNKGFSTQKVTSITPTVTNAGWDKHAWDTIPWDYTKVVPVVFSESSNKRYFNVQREMNSVQWHIYTNTIDAFYILRTLQVQGTATDAGFPRQWRLT